MFFNNADERRAWVGERPENGLSFGINFNPFGAYQVIKTAWPDMPGMVRGLESTEDGKMQMYQFLIGKMNSSGNPAQFVANFLQQVPPVAGSEKTFLK